MGIGKNARQDALEVLIDEQTLREKVRVLAGRISSDYAGKDAVLISVLKGAVIFTADLMRMIPYPVRVDFVHASSYFSSTVSSRSVLVKKDIDADISGKHVLLIDTIIDSGETLQFLLERFSQRSPASLKSVVLLDKASRRTVDVPLAYYGFNIPDRFVVGYGMDHAEQFRNLPYVAVVPE